MATLLPTAFFAALDRGVNAVAEGAGEAASDTLVNDATRAKILHISRGLAIILLVMCVHRKLLYSSVCLTDCYATRYVASRVYLHNPPGENNALTVPHDAPDAIKHEEHHLLQQEPKTNPWLCMILLIITVAVMAATAEFVSAVHLR